MIYLVVSFGAAIVIAHSAVTGLKLHRWALDNSPGLAAWIPRDGGAIGGLLAGLGAVALWLL